jgi:enamine deaminase RidA (YjgF/YER057c/UK114 family)
LPIASPRLDEVPVQQGGAVDRRKRIETDKAPSGTGYRSNAMAAAGFVFTGGHVGAPMEASGEMPVPAATLEEQVDLCLQHAEQLSLAGGAPKERVVEVSGFLVPNARQHVVRQRVRDFLAVDPPLFNLRRVRRIALEALLELDWIAVADPQITIEQATQILQPFGHARGLVRSGPFVMINALTAPGASLGEQTMNLFAKADRQLRTAGTALSNVIKLTVYIGGGEYPDFNEATKVLFADFEPPTRSVLGRALPGDSLLQVDLLVLAGSEPDS